MSKLKKVWDAVNEFKGEWLNPKAMAIIGTEYGNMYFLCTQGYDGVRKDSKYHHVALLGEFNTLVEEMKLGLDVNPVNHDHYLNYTDADKTPLEKENNPLVYTQEMADNGVLPSVGMKAMIKGFEREILLGPDSDGDYITLDANGCYDFDSANQFKPIDQRTKKEKAIDELRNLDDSICNDIKWHANFLQAIIDGKITGVKWVGE